ncbi:MAG: hypothetical protein KAW13_03310 [Dehalococcoidia bacterium]|nr:hypothetical protein [Dehalococcoidia bacterium]
MLVEDNPDDVRLIQEMAKEAGTTQFDPELVEAFCQAMNEDNRQDGSLCI